MKWQHVVGGAIAALKPALARALVPLLAGLLGALVAAGWLPPDLKLCVSSLKPPVSWQQPLALLGG